MGSAVLVGSGALLASFFMTAIELIAAERNRQTAVEGFTVEHDDAHDNHQLATAAACYALPSRISDKEVWDKPLLDLMWPWEPEWWKPEQSRIRNLVKAGALIAAEIERLQRMEARIEANVEIRNAPGTKSK